MGVKFQPVSNDVHILPELPPYPAILAADQFPLPAVIRIDALQAGADERFELFWCKARATVVDAFANLDVGNIELAAVSSFQCLLEKSEHDGQFAPLATDRGDLMLR